MGRGPRIVPVKGELIIIFLKGIGTISQELMSSCLEYNNTLFKQVEQIHNFLVNDGTWKNFNSFNSQLKNKIFFSLFFYKKFRQRRLIWRDIELMIGNGLSFRIKKKIFLSINYLIIWKKNSHEWLFYCDFFTCTGYFKLAILIDLFVKKAFLTNKSIYFDLVPKSFPAKKISSKRQFWISKTELKIVSVSKLFHNTVFDNITKLKGRLL